MKKKKNKTTRSNSGGDAKPSVSYITNVLSNGGREREIYSLVAFS